MYSTFRRRMLAGTGLVVGLGALVIGTTIAYGAVGDGSVLTACVSSKGAVRVVDAATACPAGETRVSWNKEGPVGPQGVPGPAGPEGAPGAASKPAGGSGEFAQPGRMTCTGARQGLITGDGPGGSSVTESASYNVTAPRDAATGQASGKRQHSPVTIRKQLDRASPKLFQALTQGETLSTCVFTFFTPSNQGELLESYRIKLTNAMVSDVTVTKGDTRLAGEGPLTEYESVSFTFQRIELLHTASGVTAVDDWAAQV
jgi:type VI secretion system secreted protein Hcp